ncbi:hypothetical protein [Rubritalea sp.]|uniref:hypothetical protein n=1 Tax=Rubritalea sp. TaxID=2109375 RepID=UPI003EF394D0
MKLKYTLTTMAALSFTLLSSCGKKAEAEAEHGDHAGHDHSDHEDCDHGDHEGHDHGSHEGHDHATAGPNQGLLITEVSPQAEFLVLESGKVQISFYDDSMTAVAPSTQTVTVVTGVRTSPTELSFTTEGNVLMSEQAIPSGNNFPTIVAIKPSEGAEEVITKFTLNLSDCPTCDNKEYACECHH